MSQYPTIGSCATSDYLFAAGTNQDGDTSYVFTKESYWKVNQAVDDQGADSGLRSLLSAHSFSESTENEFENYDLTKTQAVKLLRSLGFKEDKKFSSWVKKFLS